jgi:hypothetical protein
MLNIHAEIAYILKFVAVIHAWNHAKAEPQKARKERKRTHESNKKI